MPYLQFSFDYEGANAAFIKANLPDLYRAHIHVAMPAYRFVVSEKTKLPQRDNSGVTDVNFLQEIDRNDYRFQLALPLLTGGDAHLFLQYYINGLFLVSRRDAYARKANTLGLDNFIVPLQYKSGAQVLQDHEALPLLLLKDDVFESLEALEDRSGDVSEDDSREFLRNRLFLLNIREATAKLKRETAKLPLFIWFCSQVFDPTDQPIPTATIPEYQVLQSKLTGRFRELFTDNDYQLFSNIVNDGKSLFDFPFRLPAIEPVIVKGTIQFTGNAPVAYRDLNYYDLDLAYTVRGSGNQGDEHLEATYKWPNTSNDPVTARTENFDFSQQKTLLDAKTATEIRVSVKTYDGAILYNEVLTPDDAGIVQADISVPLYKPVSLGEEDGDGLPDGSGAIKGKVFFDSGKCPTKDLTVILQAKANAEGDWRVIGVSSTDNAGNFVMAYPKGVFTEARAIVSADPAKPVPVQVLTDEPHVTAQQTIAPDFLFLLMKGLDCADEADDDCDCHAPDKSVPRLPEQTDLISSGKFSQDLGGNACVNLTTPNRTLSEQNYYAIVRTSDPDVVNYVLEKKSETDADNFQKVVFTLGNGTPVTRKEVSFQNPIQWFDFTDNNKDDTVLYQSVSVATGHLLHYKSVLKADGYSLGDLVYSLPLAPGQKKQIVVYDWNRSLTASESQQLVQREGLNASIVSDRNIISELSGSLNEALSGSSRASTGGVSAGLGVGAILGPVGAVLGVSGGYSTSSSSASQNSSRNTAQAFNEFLRNSVMQSASSYRELNGTLIDTIREGQQYSVTTEVVANHNHCHSMTMLYFEVLRHFAVFQELAQVEECIFVPLIMTHFTQEKIRKWRDVLATRLLPRPSNSWLRMFNNTNPLVKAFDANERILTNWANVDYPTGRYCDEQIIDVKGQCSFRVNIPRPKTRYDRIMSLPVITKDVTHEEFDRGTAVRSTAAAILTGGLSLLFDGGNSTKTVTEQVLTRAKIFDAFMELDANYDKVPPAQCIRVTNFTPSSFTLGPITITISGADFFENGMNDKLQWEAYAKILGYTNPNGVYDMLEYYFKGRLIAEWNDIFNNDMLPVIYEKIVQSINIEYLGIDLTSGTRYKGGERLIPATFQGFTNKKRIDFPLNIKMFCNSSNAKALKDFIVFNVESLRITYSTAHYNGVLFSGRPQDNILDQDTTLFIPVSNDEKRDPRKEDKFVVNELINHLNSNLEHYNKVLMYSLSDDKRQLLLDAFHIQVYDDLGQPSVHRSLASVVKNQLIAIVGNAMVFPVAAGVRIDRSYIIVEDRVENTLVKKSLFDHYKPLTPAPPYRISVPTRGIYSEAVMGACDSCENVKDNSSQDWDKFKTDEPTPIGAVTVPTPEITDWKAAFKDFATPIVNIQNAPAQPAPGAGLAGLNELLGRSDAFRDITGLTENQKNAMATFLSNQENAKAFASMAKDMAMQAHNTANADKIQNAINDASDNGNLSKAEASQLTKDHIQQMIDGGETKKAEAAKEAAPKSTLTDAATQAIAAGKDVKATSVSPTGQAETVEVKGESDGTTAGTANKVNDNAQTIKTVGELAQYIKSAKPKSKTDFRPQTGNLNPGNIEPFAVGVTNTQYANMVYIAGDNNLSNQVFGDLLEMQNGSSNDSFTNLVLFDLEDNTGLYVVEINNNKTSLLERWTVNKDNDMEAVTVFLAKALATYSKVPYKLIGFWGHGTTSFMNKDPELNLRDLPLLPDDNTDAHNKEKSILLNQLRNIIDQSFVFNQFTQKVDVIYYDACLLQTIEMGSEMEKFAHYLVASQEVVPGTGQPYDTMIASIMSGKPSSSEAIAKLMVAAYDTFYRGAGGGDRKQTFSAVDLAALNATEGKFKTMVAHLMGKNDAAFKPFADSLYAAVQKTLQFPNDAFPPDKTKPVEATVDIIHLLDNYKTELAAAAITDTDLNTAIDDLRASVVDAVKAHFADDDIDGNPATEPVAHGLSVWFVKRDAILNDLKADLSINGPRTPAKVDEVLASINDATLSFYPQIRFVKNVEWLKFLSRYVKA